MLQGSLFSLESSWNPPSFESLPSWEDAKRVCVDVETYNPDIKKFGTAVRRDGFMCGISFAIEDGPSHYLPFKHLDGGNMDQEKVFQYFRDQGKVFKGIMVGANLNYDLDYLWEQNIFFPDVKFYRDVQIADPLIWELHMTYSLDNIAARHGVPGKDENMLRDAAGDFGIDPKKDLWKLHSKYVGAYGEGDVIAPLRILRKQEKIIEDNDLWKIYDLESRLIPVLMRMKRRGVKIDLDKLAEVEKYSVDEEKKALAKVKDITGHHIEVGNVMLVDALLPAIDFLGVKVPLTPKTKKPSIDKDFLTGLKHPVGEAILRARKVNKLRTTFAKSIRDHMVNGRIHCDIKQIAMKDDDGDDSKDDLKGGRFGRVGSNRPNLQQQPSRDEFANFWRSIYIPDDGGLWACNDYSQQEPRWTTHFAAALDLPLARIAAEKYCNDPNTDNHNMMAELTGLKRTYAKDVFLGICYGQGGARLCEILGLPTRWAVKINRQVTYYETKKEAFDYRQGHEYGYVWEAAGEKGQAILDEFNKKVPYVKELSNRVEKKAKRVGNIRTVGGRRLNFEQKPNGSYDYTYKALNKLIQGSSADQVKMAMVELDSLGHYLQLQVHDELDSSVGTVKEAHDMGNVMTNIVKARVPFKVDVEVGPSWGEIELTDIRDGEIVRVLKNKVTKEEEIFPWIDWRK